MRPIIFTAAVALVLAACQPSQRPKPAPATTLNAAAVKALCDFFEARPHEVLLTPGAEGNATNLREATGVPGPLAEQVRLYYDGETLSTAIDKDRRARLDGKYAGVINTCEAYGWKAGGRPAGGVPPAGHFGTRGLPASSRGRASGVTAPCASAPRTAVSTAIAPTRYGVQPAGSTCTAALTASSAVSTPSTVVIHATGLILIDLIVMIRVCAAPPSRASTGA